MNYQLKKQFIFTAADSKLVFFGLSLMLFSLPDVLGQSKFGISIAPGIGYIYSPNLNRIQSSRLENTPNLTQSSADKGAGFNLGIGMYYQYSINDKFALLTDPTFNFLNSKIFMNSKFESMNEQGTGRQSRVSSTAEISTMYVQVPLVLKYTFFQKRKLYLIGGVAINIMLPSTLKSREYSTRSKFGYERLTSTEVIPTETISASIDKYNPIQIAAVLGFGRQFRKKLNHVSIDIRYNYPLTKTTFYSSSDKLNKADQNNLFGEDGKKMAEVAKPQFALNDFAMGVFNLTLRYTIKKIEKAAPKASTEGAAEGGNSSALSTAPKNMETEKQTAKKESTAETNKLHVAPSDLIKESKQDRKKREKRETLEKDLPVRP